MGPQSANVSPWNVKNGPSYRDLSDSNRNNDDNIYGLNLQSAYTHKILKEQANTAEMKKRNILSSLVGTDELLNGKILSRNASNETIPGRVDTQKSRPSDESMEMEGNNSNETRYRVLNARGEYKAKELNSSMANYDPLEAITFTLSSQLHNNGTIQYSPNSKHTANRYD